MLILFLLYLLIIFFPEIRRLIMDIDFTMKISSNKIGRIWLAKNNNCRCHENDSFLVIFICPIKRGLTQKKILKKLLKYSKEKLKFFEIFLWNFDGKNSDFFVIILDENERENAIGGDFGDFCSCGQKLLWCFRK